MEIGAGGLQSVILNDMIRSMDSAIRPKGNVQETLVQAQGQDQNQLKKELNRAVERLNHLAESLNYPVQFAIKEPPPRLKVVIKDKNTGKERELEFSELDQLAVLLEDNRGVQLDSYT